MLTEKSSVLVYFYDTSIEKCKNVRLDQESVSNFYIAIFL